MKVLIADDEVTTRRSIEALLAKWGYEVVAASDGEEAWQVLQREDSPRLAVLDWMMPGMDGVAICKSLRQLRSEPYTYVILLTGNDRKEDVVSGLEAGADDYLTKPFNTYELKARVRTGQRIITLQRELIAARDALKEQATHDPLTGLWNRGAIMEILGNELSRGVREGTPLVIVMADIDHFKRINDSFGHLVGDAVLREVARRLRASVRPYDSVGRYGGEEFLVVFSGYKSVPNINQATRLREVIAATPVVYEGAVVPVTLSFGVATWNRGCGVDLKPLLASADAALYSAKELGRNRVEVAPQPGSPSNG